eukprot:COSAG01_NODE_25586_length_740_cov_1.014041_1_plen_226_part_10
MVWPRSASMFPAVMHASMHGAWRVTRECADCVLAGADDDVADDDGDDDNDADDANDGADPQVFPLEQEVLDLIEDGEVGTASVPSLPTMRRETMMMSMMTMMRMMMRRMRMMMRRMRMMSRVMPHGSRGVAGCRWGASTHMHSHARARAHTHKHTHKHTHTPNVGIHVCVADGWVPHPPHTQGVVAAERHVRDTAGAREGGGRGHPHAAAGAGARLGAHAGAAASR